MSQPESGAQKLREMTAAPIAVALNVQRQSTNTTSSKRSLFCVSLVHLHEQGPELVSLVREKAGNGKAVIFTEQEPNFDVSQSPDYECGAVRSMNTAFTDLKAEYGDRIKVIFVDDFRFVLLQNFVYHAGKAAAQKAKEEANFLATSPSDFRRTVGFLAGAAYVATFLAGTRSSHMLKRIEEDGPNYPDSALFLVAGGVHVKEVIQAVSQAEMRGSKVTLEPQRVNNIVRFNEPVSEAYENGLKLFGAVKSAVGDEPYVNFIKEYNKTVSAMLPDLTQPVPITQTMYDVIMASTVENLFKVAETISNSNLDTSQLMKLVAASEPTIVSLSSSAR